MCKNHTLFETKMGKIDTFLMTKMVKNSYPLGQHIPIAHIRKYPPLHLTCSNQKFRSKIIYMIYKPCPSRKCPSTFNYEVKTS